MNTKRRYLIANILFFVGLSLLLAGYIAIGYFIGWTLFYGLIAINLGAYLLKRAYE